MAEWSPYLIEPYSGNDPYVFISYPHSEAVKVGGILRLLYRKGVRFWYDGYIFGGTNWKDRIDERLRHSQMFLCFLANGIEQRPEVLREIQWAIRRKEEDPAFRVLFVFLEKIPANLFGLAGCLEIETFVETVQHLFYNGITEEFVGRLFGRDVFPDSLIREECLSEWRNRGECDLQLEMEKAFPENTYVVKTMFPEKRKEDTFFRVRMSEISPDAVCLICLDNQWCPPEFYDDAEFWQMGLLSPRIAERQADLQAREVFRALLNSRQVIVNRAYFFNSLVFGRWYDREHPDYEPFCELLSDGSFLVYLTTEDMPYDPANRPKFSTNHYAQWGELCREHPVYCLRLDWNDNATNRLKVQQLLFHRFQNFCLTMGENHYLLDQITSVYQLTPGQASAFKKTWSDVQIHAATRDREERSGYTRELFYRRFVTRKGTNVSDCIVDVNKPFAPMMKDVVDFQYDLNLPLTLNVRPVYPPMGRLQSFYRSSDHLRENTREISSDELTFAIRQFVPSFLDTEVDFRVDPEVFLYEIQSLRKMPQWESFIQALINGNKRAHLQEVDFYDIAVVWERYYQWMKAAREKDDISENWISEEGALTIRYRLDQYEILTVYTGSGKPLYIRSSIPPAGSLPKEHDHTALLTIDYLCADIRKHDPGESPMLAEHCLFEGITRDRLSVAAEALLNCLTSLSAERAEGTEADTSRTPSAPAPVPVGDPAVFDPFDRKHYDFERYVKDKSNSEIWLRYQELMAKRPEQFLPHDMLTIITDLREICAFEQRTGKIIGVRYINEPYSMMVVDLVRDPKGNTFAYERMMPCVPRGAAVCLTRWDDRYVLLRQYRHALRDFQLSFPRGYGEYGLTGEENAAKEVSEELGTTVKSTRFLGEIIADSGCSGNHVEVYLCEINEPQLMEKYEGIKDLLILTADEIRQMMKSRELNDGFTLGALALLGFEK